jgi:hypothetical protein
MLSDLDPQPFPATEGDKAGALVGDLMLVNAYRVIRIEADAAERTLRSQLDHDGWLRVVLLTEGTYDRALERVRAAFSDDHRG